MWTPNNSLFAGDSTFFAKTVIHAPEKKIEALRANKG